MKKNCKRFLSLTLVFVMLMSIITGCGGTDEPIGVPVNAKSLLESANKTVSEANSIDSTLKMDLNMTMGSEEMQMIMEMHMNADLESHIKSGTAHMNATIDAMMFGFKIQQKQEMYLVNEDGKKVTYERTIDGEEKSDWTYSIADKESEEETIDSLSELNDVFATMLEQIDAFTLAAETEMINSTECYKVSGKIKGAAGIFDKMDMEDVVGEINPEDLEVSINVYFTKANKKLHKLEIDMAEGMMKLYDTQENTKEVSEEETDNMLDLDGEVKVDAFMISIIYKSFNTVEEITVPSAVKEKAVEKNDEWEDWEDDKWEDWEDDTEYVTTICPHCNAFNSRPAEDIANGKITCGLCDKDYEYTEEE